MSIKPSGPKQWNLFKKLAEARYGVVLNFSEK